MQGYPVAKRLSIHLLGQAGIGGNVVHVTLDWKKCQPSGQILSPSGDRGACEKSRYRHP
jgi:hypothetical protein